MLFNTEFVLMLALISTGAAMLHNYAIGKPGGKFSPHEIFSFYTVWLSIRRLKVVGLYDNYAKQYSDNLQRVKTKAEIITLNQDFKKLLYDAADPFFTWERAVGMCINCTGFWISLLISILAQANIVETISIIVISHILVRIISKLL